MMPKPLPTLVDRLKALAHPVRLRILGLLREGELCVCQVVEVTELAPSTISEHLAALRRAGFVVERKDGRWVYYGLNPEPALAALREALWPQLEADPQRAQDRTRLEGLKRHPLAEVCARVYPR